VREEYGRVRIGGVDWGEEYKERALRDRLAGQVTLERFLLLFSQG